MSSTFSLRTTNSPVSACVVRARAGVKDSAGLRGGARSRGGRRIAWAPSRSSRGCGPRPLLKTTLPSGIFKRLKPPVVPQFWGFASRALSAGRPVSVLRGPGAGGLSPRHLAKAAVQEAGRGAASTPAAVRRGRGGLSADSRARSRAGGEQSRPSRRQGPWQPLPPAASGPPGCSEGRRGAVLRTPWLPAGLPSGARLKS